MARIRADIINWPGEVPGASKGVPIHDKFMRESPDRQSEAGLEGSPRPA